MGAETERGVGLGEERRCPDVLPFFEFLRRVDLVWCATVVLLCFPRWHVVVERGVRCHNNRCDVRIVDG